MGSIIAVLGVLLAILALASFWVLKIAKGAKLEVINEVQDDILTDQHDQLKAAQDRPNSLEEWGNKIDKGGDDGRI